MKFAHNLSKDEGYGVHGASTVRNRQIDVTQRLLHGGFFDDSLPTSGHRSGVMGQHYLVALSAEMETLLLGLGSEMVRCLFTLRR